MERYRPSDEPQRLTISNLTYGLLREFYKKGPDYTITIDEGLLLDQRSFGPSVARGLFANDGHVWFMTPEGRDFVKQYEGRSPWKDSPSKQFSHYIKIIRAVSGKHRATSRRRAA